jgi:uncharacterized protein (UPF0371 family)
MRSVEILPKNGSHYLVVDGVEVSRHNEVAVAEKVRQELIRRYYQAQEPARDQEREVER